MIWENRYRDIEFPFSDSFRQEDIIMTTESTAQHFLGEIESWSNYQKYKELQPDAAKQFLKNIELQVQSILRTNDLSQAEIKINYNFFLLMGRKKLSEFSS